MARPGQHRIRIFMTRIPVAATGLAFAMVWGLTIGAAHVAQAQTFSVIYNFKGGLDGAYPFAGLTTDGAGNLYGTTEQNQYGMQGYGNVFKLSRSQSGWTLTTLYTFGVVSGGLYPWSRVVFGPDGNLYGTTTSGGIGRDCCGVVYKLTPPKFCGTVFCPWTETVLHRFTGGNDGYWPAGDLVFDATGNIYGTAYYGGSYGVGTVYELSPDGKTFSVLYAFGTVGGWDDGSRPLGGVVFGPDGSLYGTTQYGGTARVGTVFKLAPSELGWTESRLYDFQDGSDGAFPWGGVIADASGTLYGSTQKGGAQNEWYGGGTLFKLTPSQGDWTFSVLHTFAGYLGPENANLIMDARGNLYGTVWQDAPLELGSVFALTAHGHYIDVHDFTNGSDGGFPACTLVMDANGNLYGTTNTGGAYGYGVVFKVKSPPSP